MGYMKEPIGFGFLISDADNHEEVIIYEFSYDKALRSLKLYGYREYGIDLYPNRNCSLRQVYEEHYYNGKCRW